MTQEELELLEVSNQAAKVAIAKGEAFKRLLKNDDYKLVISEGYFKEYAKDLGTAIASNTGAYDTESLIEDLKAINGLVKYGFMVASAHDAAEADLAHNEQYVANSTKEEE